MKASGKLRIHGMATLSATYAGTGRLVHGDHVYGRVQAWTRLLGTPLFRLNRIHREVRSDIVSLPLAKLNDLLLYRGIPFAPPYKPSSDAMGPPPPHLRRSGRYNRGNDSVLYLGTSLSGVRRELQASTDPIWVQPFHLGGSCLRIADISSTKSVGSGLVAASFWFAELSGSDGYPTIAFSQHLASLVAKHFDGMLIPGVRGCREAEYDNVLIFSQVHKWTEWLTNEPPRLLAEV